MFPGYKPGLAANIKSVDPADIPVIKTCPKCKSEDVTFLYSISDGMRMNDQYFCEDCEYEWEN